MPPTLKTYWNLFSYALLALTGVWVWFSAPAEGQTTAGKIPAPRSGFLAPDFTLQSLSGQEVSLQSLRGKAVIVNLWASWCIPCRAEMPALQDVYEQYQDAGLELLAVNSTTQDSPEAARAFAEQNQLTFPILLDTQGYVAEQYGLRALPTTFFIDRQGIIQDVIIGGPMSEALIRTRVEQILTEVEP